MHSFPGSGITVEESEEEPEAMDNHKKTGFWHSQAAAYMSSLWLWQLAHNLCEPSYTKSQHQGKSGALTLTSNKGAAGKRDHFL